MRMQMFIVYMVLPMFSRSERMHCKKCYETLVWDKKNGIAKWLDFFHIVSMHLVFIYVCVIVWWFDFVALIYTRMRYCLNWLESRHHLLDDTNSRSLLTCLRPGLIRIILHSELIRPRPTRFWYENWIHVSASNMKSWELHIRVWLLRFSQKNAAPVQSMGIYLVIRWYNYHI